MTTENTNTEQTSQPRVTVALEQDTQAVTFGANGSAESRTATESLNQSFDASGNAEELTPEEIAELEGDEGEGEGSGEGQEPKDGDEATEGDEPKEEPEGDAAELPEWDGDSDEVVSAYEAKYIGTDEDGGQVLNFEAFNDEFAKDRGDGKRDLNAGTRKFLKDRFGISDKLIDQHLAGVIAQEQQIESAFHLQFAGTPEEGKKVFDSMFGWAKDNYSQQQKDRYNAAMKAGGEEAQEQIELLKTRYLSKNPGKSEQQDTRKIGLKRERSVSPKKDATNGATATAQAAAPFANAGEHRVAQNEALAMKPGPEREAAIAKVRQRLAASTFWRP